MTSKQKRTFSEADVEKALMIYDKQAVRDTLLGRTGTRKRAMYAALSSLSLKPESEVRKDERSRLMNSPEFRLAKQSKLIGRLTSNEITKKVHSDISRWGIGRYAIKEIIKKALAEAQKETKESVEEKGVVVRQRKVGQLVGSELSGKGGKSNRDGVPIATAPSKSALSKDEGTAEQGLSRAKKEKKEERK